ncbi:PEP-CTERM sorting domain-containing protein [Bythopirellula polymerisocia]|uniref:PEP-CTERM protein-sorting domain-containing protein n=1 Tax=Bythopirellula polymerisocia TaxID=2528003 RepID=A0A5C6BYR0_9BACT|nr:PEP-CTERM sorting domain-containing protein [Bythopirellula polymerisocia]TWU17470.1 hypothetical protein Pla144_51230 [Bythopirellula polymerisocia]
MKKSLVLVCLGLALLAGRAHAAFLIEIDTDGLDDAILTYNSHFTFGGDTTQASQSSASSAFGLTGGDSIFGGDGVNEPDTYVYRYDPTTDADNLNTTGQVLGVDLLGNPVGGTGKVGGAAGDYRIYAAWPETVNVNSAGVDYTAVSGANSYSVHVDQNDPAIQGGWVYLGDITYDGSSGIILKQEAVVNSFVSMRSAAVMFEPVPEPTSILLTALGFCCFWARPNRMVSEIMSRT